MLSRLYCSYLALFMFLVLLVACISPVHAQAATCVVGAKGAAPTITLNFGVPTLNTDGTAIATPLTYNVYASTTSGAETKQVTALTGEPLIISSGLALTPNTTIYIKLTVTDAKGNEGALSNEVCKTFPVSVPGTLTITIT
jgi:hypothetical protein